MYKNTGPVKLVEILQKYPFVYIISILHTGVNMYLFFSFLFIGFEGGTRVVWGWRGGGTTINWGSNRMFDGLLLHHGTCTKVITNTAQKAMEALGKALTNRERGGRVPVPYGKLTCTS